MKKEGEEVEEGWEWLLKDRNSPIIFRVLFVMIIEKYGIVESSLDLKSADLFSWLSFVAL